jgi:cyclopropane-fatty-acyl-phospholipid synthase
MMSLLESSRSLLILPREYKSIQPHHALVLYGVVQLVSRSGLYKKISNQILSMLSQTAEHLIPLVYMGMVPDFLVRFGIRIQLRDRLATLRRDHVETELSDKLAIVKELHDMPIAIHTADANDQHYEVPSAFYDLCLGPRKKYSSGLWPTPTTTFEESEVHMLDLYCERAGVVDGMAIVDLGCGWGSLTLHLAEKYPNCKITSISNSHSQKEYIMSTASVRGYNVNNINVVTVSIQCCFSFVARP